MSLHGRTAVLMHTWYDRAHFHGIDAWGACNVANPRSTVLEWTRLYVVLGRGDLDLFAGRIQSLAVKEVGRQFQWASKGDRLADSYCFYIIEKTRRGSDAKCSIHHVDMRKMTGGRVAQVLLRYTGVLYWKEAVTREAEHATRIPSIITAIY